MAKLVWLGVLACTGAVVLATPDGVQNMDRVCPSGYFYAGEAINSNASSVARDSIWIEGPTSPVYSCYKFIKDDKSFAGGNLACNSVEEATSQLVSVETRLEDSILASTLFWERVPDEMKKELLVKGALTSGIQLAPNNWTWFGADVPVDTSKIMIEDSSNASLIADQVTCLLISWSIDSNSTTSILFTPVVCSETQTFSLCEVHVYTQTWYVWFYSNWLQILLFVTMLLLIFSACCLFQALFFRTRVRTGQPVPPRPNQQQQTRAFQPPPYTARQPVAMNNRPPPAYSTPQDDSFIHESPAERYMRKGREIMGQVTFFKPASVEKPPLPN